VVSTQSTFFFFFFFFFLAGKNFNIQGVGRIFEKIN
jgi:hypothetical protein